MNATPTRPISPAVTRAFHPAFDPPVTDFALPADFMDRYRRDGYAVVENVFTPAQVAALSEAIEDCIAADAAYQGTKDYVMYGITTSLFKYADRHPIFFDVYRHRPYIAPYEAIMGELCITYSLTNVSAPPNGKTFASVIHVDVPRIITDMETAVAGMALMCDFTEQNGATWYLPGSQNRPDKPSEEEFYAKAKRIIAPAGSVCYFNLRTWHAGAFNNTDNWRHTLILMMVQPWMKQRLDVPRLLADNPHVPTFSRELLQKLGFLCQVPASYEEFYHPKYPRQPNV